MTVYASTLVDDDAEAERRFDYELPDGQVIYIGDASWRCAEALFQLALLGIEGGGLPAHVYDAAMVCDAEVEPLMLQDVVLAGGNMLFAGKAARMQRELRTLSAGVLRFEVSAGVLRFEAAEKRLALGAVLHQRLGAAGVISAADIDMDVVGRLAELVECRAGVRVLPAERYSAWLGVGDGD